MSALLEVQPHATPPAPPPPPVKPPPVVRPNAHSSRQSTGPRNIDKDLWLNDDTSNRSLGRVLKVTQRANGRTLVVTTACRVVVDARMIARQGRDARRLALHSHKLVINDTPVE